MFFHVQTCYKMASCLYHGSVRIIAITLDWWKIWINPTSLRTGLADSYNIFNWWSMVQQNIVYMHFYSSLDACKWKTKWWKYQVIYLFCIYFGVRFSHIVANVMYFLIWNQENSQKLHHFARNWYFVRLGRSGFSSFFPIYGISLF